MFVFHLIFSYYSGLVLLRSIVLPLWKIKKSSILILRKNGLNAFYPLFKYIMTVTIHISITKSQLLRRMNWMHLQTQYSLKDS